MGNRYTGSGTTIGFGSKFSDTVGDAVYELTNVAIDGITREAAKSSHTNLSTAPGDDFGTDTFLPGTVVQCGKTTAEGWWNPDITPPIADAAALLTITWPNATTWVGSAIIESFDFTVPHEDMMGFVSVWQMTGGWTIT